MSIENIIEKILDEAKIVAESSLNNANDRSLEITNEAKIQGDAAIAEALTKANIEAETLKSRQVSAAELQSRKMLLIAKQDAINKSFDLAIDELAKMPQDKYIKFLADEVLKIPNCSGEIILNENDKKNIGEDLVKIVNKNVKENKVVLSSKIINARGGFILKNGEIEINSTFETILSSVKYGLTFEVANALFK